MMSRLRRFALLLLATLGLAGGARAVETQEVAGVVWTYSVVSNAAVIGDVVETNYTPAISRDTVGEINIPAELGGLPVVDIAPHAFSGCTNVTAVVLPEAVTNISRGAFSSVIVPWNESLLGCPIVGISSTLVGYEKTTTTNGGTIVQTLIPTYSMVTNVRMSACEQLTSILLPESLQVIRADAFAECHNLAAVTFSGSVDTIENGAFCGCEKLRSINLPIGIRCLGGLPATISQTLTGYDVTTTTNSGTTTQTLTPRYKTIYFNNNGGPSSNGVFEGCVALESVSLPSGVGEIGLNAFKRCKRISHLEIPDSVGTIGQGAFSECVALTEFTFPKNCIAFDPCSSAENGLFFGCSRLQTVEVPAGVMNLPNYAFANCVLLKAVNFAGDKPSVDGNELFIGTPNDLVVNVRSDASGWYDPITYGRLALWQRRRVAYDGVPPAAAEEMSDDEARCLLEEAICLMQYIGATLSEEEKREYFHSIQDMIERRPALLSCAGVAAEALGLCLSDEERVAFSKWALSVASRKLNPPSNPSSSVAGGAGGGVVEAKLVVTNVVLHYVVNSITPDLAVPVTTDTGIVNVMTEIKGGNIAIPDSWITNYPTFKATFGSDFATALMKATGKVDAGGKPMLVWQDFVAGTDPTDESDVFQASVTMVDGLPVISYTPELSDAEKAKRRYVTWGKVRLQDANWVEVAPGHESDYNFFRVTVEMR